MDWTFVIAIVLFIIGVLIWIYFSNRRAKTKFNTQREAELHRLHLEAKSEKEFQDHIAILASQGYPTEKINQLVRERREASQVPLGPTHLFAFQDMIITYEIASSESSLFVDQQLTNILTAHPDANLKKYEKDLNIRIVRIDQPKRKRPIGFVDI
jgi:hypothetical protein